MCRGSSQIVVATLNKNEIPIVSNIEQEKRPLYHLERFWTEHWTEDLRIFPNNANFV